MIRLVVFDCDGTLVDSESAIVDAMTAALAALRVPDRTPDEIRHHVGLSLGETARELLPDADEDLRGALVTRYRREYSALRARPDFEQALFPGARAVLHQLSERGTLLAIATGKSRRGLIHTLEHHGLSSSFHSLQTADDAPSKPHPGMVLRAMEETGSQAAATVMVGDTTFDIEAGLNAGARAIGVAWGNHSAASLRASGAETVLESFDQLLPHLFGAP